MNINTVAKLFGRAPIDSGNIGCALQGFLIQQLSFSIWLLELGLCYYLIMIIIYEKRFSIIKTYESTIITCALIVPLPICKSQV